MKNYKRSVLARHCRGAERKNSQLLGQHAQDPCKCKPVKSHGADWIWMYKHTPRCGAAGNCELLRGEDSFSPSVASIKLTTIIQLETTQLWILEDWRIKKNTKLSGKRVGTGPGKGWGRVNAIQTQRTNESINNNIHQWWLLRKASMIGIHTAIEA